MKVSTVVKELRYKSGFDYFPLQYFFTSNTFLNHLILRMLYKPFFLSLILLLSLSFALDNDVGISPPMGWNGWNHFKCDLNEDIVKKTVDRMVEL